MPLNFNATERHFKNLTPKQRSETTFDLAMYLAEIIKIIASPGDIFKCPDQGSLNS
jgi:hypothetical protein